LGFSVWLFVYQAGETGFFSEMRSRDKADLAWKLRLLRIDLFAEETRFIWVLVFGYWFTKLVKPGF
jgi:hypothetical protein